MKIRIHPWKAFLCLLLAFSGLLIAHLVVLVLMYGLEHSMAYRLANLFHFNREQNVPTLYSSNLYLISAFLLTTISIVQRDQKEPFYSWVFLAVIFVFLSFDEVVKIHEKFTGFMDLFLETSGYFNYAWVIPYGILVMILGLAYLKFFFRLPTRVRNLFFLSATVFLSGAIGMEMIAANYYDKNEVYDLTFDLLATVEESLEILGLSLFVYSLLSFLSLKGETIEWSFLGSSSNLES